MGKGMECEMMDRRKFKRLPIDLRLEVSQIFKQDHQVMNDIKADLEVCDISKSGIGFWCKEELPLDYYFNGKIVLGEENMFFYAVVKIVRKERKEGLEGILYGAEFVGLAPFLGDKVDKYAKEIESNH